MRKLLFLIPFILHGATYYVATSGNDSNDGSIGSPFLTLDKPVQLSVSGDIINLIPGGGYINCDTILPYKNGSKPVIIQSSNWPQFEPDGYRTTPTADLPIYGKCQTSAGITWMPEVHGSATNEGAYTPFCPIASITANVITIGICINQPGLPNLVNGSQVKFEQDSLLNFNATTFPTGLTPLTHFFVTNCSVGCGTSGSTLQIATTLGGSPIAIGPCTGSCVVTTIFIGEPLQFTAGSPNIISPDAFVNITNKTPVALSATGIQTFGLLPPEFAIDTVYYIQNLSGRIFQLSSDLNGSNIITPSTTGFGSISLSNVNAAHDWIIRGLEIFCNTYFCGQIILGTGNEASPIATVRNIEISHVYFHDDPTLVNGPVRAITNNGRYIYIHDNTILGMRTGESQAIASCGSPGPTVIRNNFLEAAGEVILLGGCGNISGVANSNILSAGNYFYKPPIWKVADPNLGIPNVGVDPCLWDNTDPFRTGGEWYINAGINYQCGSDKKWHTTGLTPPVSPTVKNSFETKDVNNLILTGNLHNYSWTGGQSGQCMTFHQSSDSGAGVDNSNITAIYNKCLNVYFFTESESRCLISPFFPCLARDGITTNYAKNHNITHNIASQNYLACGIILNGSIIDCGFNIQQNGWGYNPEKGFTFIHNTVVGPDLTLIHSNVGYTLYYNPLGTCSPFNGPSDSWTYRSNIVSYDFGGDCFTPGGTVIGNYFTHFTGAYNVMVNSTRSYSSPGATNTFSNFDQVTNNAAMQYVNFTNNDFHLTPGSPHSADCSSGCLTKSDDNTDAGADVDLVNMKTSGAASGLPPWDQLYGLKIIAESQLAVLKYNAPSGSTVCTVTVYNALARIVANQVFTGSDSAGNSISDGVRRELLVYSGLTASTVYQYKLDCGSGIIMVGNFKTKAAGSGTYKFNYQFSSARTLNYSVNSNMSSPTTLGSALTQTVPVAANSVIYAQYAGGEINILLGQ